MKTQLDTLVERLLQRAGVLYSLPAVAVKVLELADDPQLDTHRLKNCIENDPALTSRILRVVNSSLFGLSSPVSDLNQAITLLGVKPLKLLVLGFSLPEGLYTGVSADVLRYYWRHTLTKAVACRELCQVLWRQSGDDAFLVGLLQDLGMLLLIQSLGEPYQEFVRRVQTMGKDLIALESQVLGFDHTALTARVLQDWRLPEGIVRWISWDQIRQTLQTDSPKAPVLAQVIHLAEGLARVLADRQPGYLNEVLSAGAKYRGLTQIQLEAMVAELEIKVAQLAEVLHLDLPPVEDYRTILLEAHRRMAETATEVVQLLLSRQPGSGSEPDSLPPALESHLARLSEAVQRFTASKTGRKQKPSEASFPKPMGAHEAVAHKTETEGTSLSEAGEPRLGSSMGQDGAKGTKTGNVSSWEELLDSVEETCAEAKSVGAASKPGGTGSGLTQKSGSVAGSASGPTASSLGHPSGRGGQSAARSRTGSTQTVPVDPGLVAHLKASVAACRNARAPLSLLLAEPEQTEDLLLRYGPEGMERFRGLLQVAAEALGHEGSLTLPYGEWGVALVLPDCDRQEAVRLGHQLIAAIRQVPWGGVWNNRGSVALGVGVANVAMPPKNFPAEDLLEAAARCLFGSHASGGGVVKSIEIY